MGVWMAPFLRVGRRDRLLIYGAVATLAGMVCSASRVAHTPYHQFRHINGSHNWCVRHRWTAYI